MYSRGYSFSQGYFLYFFLKFALDWVFRVGFLVDGPGVGPSSSGFFWGWGSLNKHKRIGLTLGKNGAFLRVQSKLDDSCVLECSKQAIIASVSL